MDKFTEFSLIFHKINVHLVKKRGQFKFQ